MYKRLLVAVDNSKFAEQAGLLALELAKKFRTSLTGVHVKNAGLHTYAFRLLEGTLPTRFQSEACLQQQREIHESLIRKGLAMISDSYLVSLQQAAQTAAVPCETKILEGRHFEVLSREISDEAYEGAVFGDRGLGAGGCSPLGSVVERIARRIRKDLFVVKNRSNLEDGKILVAVDGSECSFWALRKAIVLAKRFQAQLFAVHVFDPEFHRTVFRELVGVLSEAAAQVFDFESQQRLHDETIDKGLEQVGQRYLHSCELAAGHGGIPIHTTLLKGKFFQKIVGKADSLEPALVVVGRWGRHQVDSSDLGSTAEHVLRFASCSVLLVSTDVPDAFKRFHPPQEIRKNPSPTWSIEADARVRRAPVFVQEMARRCIEEWAGRHGLPEIQSMHVSQALQELLPEKMWHKILKEEP
jgi:nucleotide-binding universal stress UspA family protein